MKLHEEFKLYEDMWEDEVPATEEALAEEETVETADPLIRTFGRKTYNLANPDELDAWVDANFEFQQKRYPYKYRDAEGITSNWFRLRSRVAKNLLSKLQAEGVDNPQVIKQLQDRATSIGSRLATPFAEDELNKLFADFTQKLSVYFDAKEVRMINTDLNKLKQKLFDFKNFKTGLYN
jgi:hypothetical protein